MEMIGEICNSPHLDYLKNLKLEMKDKCKVYCEIGVLYGGSMIMMMNMNYPCLHIGIDPFEGYYGKTFDPHRQVDLTNHFDIVSENIKKNNKYFQQWNLIKGKSNEVHNEITEKIDFLFIDGDHSYKGVLDDFNNFKDKVNIDGYICFDNYNDPSWSEVKIACDVAIKDNDFEIIDERKYCLTLRKIK